MKTFTVDAEALRQVLLALLGPGHHIREMQATRSLHNMGYPNPIDILIGQVNEQQAALPAEVVGDRDRFERAYATKWQQSRSGPETVEELQAELRGYREGDTYGVDLPRLRFGWEGFQFALAADTTTEAVPQAPEGGGT